MSDSDSFINEVTEEVRRDRLFGLMRRWGWVAGVVVVAIVGTAAYVEFTRSQEEARAQAFGDSLLAALEQPVVEDRVAALAEITPDTAEAGMILALLASGELAQAGDPEAAAARLRAAADVADLPVRYRHLALLRAEMMDPSEPAAARLLLEALAAPGAPYAALAQEQLALLSLREGDVDGAVALLRRIEDGAATTPGLQQRASQLIVALEAGSVLVDVSPVVEVEDTAPEGDVEQSSETDADGSVDPTETPSDAPAETSDTETGTDEN